MCGGGGIHNGWRNLGDVVTGETNNLFSNIVLNGDGTIYTVVKVNFFNFIKVVQVYELQENKWKQKGQDLLPTIFIPGVQYSVSMNEEGSRVAVGDPEEEGTNGKAHVFEWNGTQWAPLGNVLEGVDSLFGTNVSLNSSGSRLSVGIPDLSETPTNDGKVIVFELDGEVWNQLGGNIENSNSIFGVFTSLNGLGNRVAITNFENAFVYQLNGATWEQLGSAIPAKWISIDEIGNRLATGNPSLIGTENGIVNVLEWNGADWEKLGDDIVGSSKDFGISVFLNNPGNRVVIGSPELSEETTEKGFISVYELKADDWKQVGGDIVGESPLNSFVVSINSDGSRVATFDFIVDGLKKGLVPVYIEC